MPGILPMKVIRVGNSAQARIAQACDRCRSKKIRCDGIRPCCTQCANVGFECKTSDKLSRRAFPRGYTESLEDRVRGLEAEVRELKDLLDEKDEKIDMLSRLQSFSPPSRKCSTTLSPGSIELVKQEMEAAKEDVLLVEIPPLTSTSDVAGASSTAAFIEAFDQKAHDDGHDDADIRPGKFAQLSRPLTPSSPLPRTMSRIPPRLLSDQYINLFFQEWQPLLPILHRPSFLRIYEDYLTDPEAGQWQSNKQAIAQLFIIFEISALSSAKVKQTSTPYETQWRKALQSTSSTVSLGTVQCHVLAQLYYLLKADYVHLTRHRAIAVAMCHQLGLHQGHKYRGLPVLESETRKKVLWSQYVLDKFTSATTGSPMLLHDRDITTDFPADIDDENISAHGVSPSLPGELTKISSAIAFFRVAKILSATLTELYPSGAKYELSLEKLHSLSDELDQWSQSLPSHLRLQFKQDKPSTNTVSCRSPLLSIAYFYTRSLIHRPLVVNGSGSAASSSTIVLAAAGKHVMQILDLLDERRMNYTFPLNKSELVLSSGFSLLWQCLDIDDDSKIFKDNQKSLNGLLTMLLRDTPMVGLEFQRIASTYIHLNGLARPMVPSSSHMDINQAAKHLNAMSAPDAKHKSTRKSIQAIASRFSPSTSKHKNETSSRSRSIPINGTTSSLSPQVRTLSSASLSSTQSAPVVPMASPQPRQLQPRPRPFEAQPTINLDYFPLGDPNGLSESTSRTQTPAKGQLHLTDTAWEQLLTNIDLTDTTPQDEVDAAFPDWTPAPDPDAWSIGELNAKAAVPQSVLSFSEESLTSGEDLVFSRCASNNGSTGSASTAIDSLESSAVVENQGDAFKGIAIPFDDDFDFHA